MPEQKLLEVKNVDGEPMLLFDVERINEINDKITIVESALSQIEEVAIHLRSQSIASTRTDAKIEQLTVWKSEVVEKVDTLRNRFNNVLEKNMHHDQLAAMLENLSDRVEAIEAVLTKKSKKTKRRPARPAPPPPPPEKKQ